MPDGQVIKLVNATSLDAGLTSIADAIREKGGTSADLTFPNGFVSAVEAIQTGGGENFKLLITDANGTTTPWSSPSMQNTISTNGILEVTFTDTNPANDFGNIFSIGLPNELTVYNSINVIHFYHRYHSDNGTSDEVVCYYNRTSYDQAIDSTSQVTIKIENGYIYINGTQIVAIPANIQGLATIAIGSKEGSKRFQGIYNRITYK